MCATASAPLLSPPSFPPPIPAGPFPWAQPATGLDGPLCPPGELVHSWERPSLLTFPLHTLPPSLLPLSIQWLLQRFQPFLSKTVGWSWDFTYPDGPEPFASRPGLTLGFWCSFQIGSSMSSKPRCFPGIARNQPSASSWGGREGD